MAVSLQGNGGQSVGAMALDAEGNIYLTGSTTSSDLGTPGAFKSRRASSNLSGYDAASGKFNLIFPPDTTAISSLVTDPGHPATVYAVTRSGFIRSADSGQTWTVLSHGLPHDANPTSIRVAPSDSNVLYATFFPDSGGASVFRSADAGTNWLPASPLPNPPGVASPLIPTSVSIDPADSRHVFVVSSPRTGGYFCFGTIDGGASWIQSTTSLTAVAFDPSSLGVVYAVATDSSLLKSTDNGASFLSVKIVGPGPLYVYAVWADARRPGAVNVLVQNQVLRTTDSANSFTTAFSFPGGIFVNQFLEDPDTGVLYARTGTAILRSDDGSRTWTDIQASAGAMAIPKSGTLLLGSGINAEMFVSKLDPDGGVIFTTYLGGSSGSKGTAITVDSSGEIYAGAETQSLDFPRTASTADPINTPIYLLKLSADGTRLRFSTLISGATSEPNALALDPAGNIYLAGTAYVPTPSNRPRRSYAYVQKFAPDGKTLLYYARVTSGDFGVGRTIAVDPDGNAYVGGSGLYKIDASGGLRWGVRLGFFRAVTLDKAGNLYACGNNAYDFQSTPNAFQKTYPSHVFPSLDASQIGVWPFAAKFSPAGDILYATLLAGEGWEAQEATAIAVDEQGNAIVTGLTESMDFPQKYSAQGPFNRRSTGFLAKLNADGSDLLYSTYVGDAHTFSGAALGLQPSGRVILAGVSTLPDGTENVILTGFRDKFAPPPIHVDSVLNAASMMGGAIAPGEWIVVRGGGFGPDSRLLIGDSPAPITYVTNTQMLARVPDALPLGGASIHVESADQSSARLLLDTAPSAPAIFVQEKLGYQWEGFSAQAVAFNADGTRNGQANPAAAGSVIELVVNGLGTPGRQGEVQVFLFGDPAYVCTEPCSAPATQRFGDCTSFQHPYCKTGVAVPAEVRTRFVPDLPGGDYTVVRVPMLGRSALVLSVNGVIQGPAFAMIY